MPVVQDAPQYDITIVRITGEGFAFPFLLKNDDGTAKDITGATVTVAIWGSPYSDPILTLDNAAIGGVTLVGATGSITVLLTADQVVALDFVTGAYRINMVEANGNVTPLLKGAVQMVN